MTEIKPTDFSSPYYLSNSDNPGVGIMGVKLAGANYWTWSKAMSNALRAKNKAGFIDGSTPKPKEGTSGNGFWEQCNSMLIGWIFNSLDPNLQPSVTYITNAPSDVGRLEAEVFLGKRDLDTTD
ncbi:hypothetical protein CRG98_043546 [Punica granatum]|uniref:Retrotransposon Copia-like N-terminal domain-containing protein n=1 Tax=Punica granatum TaxID=22663 RepID=A0A2I0HWJ2_PUNGR|nr:hypothetical protein CRG98_043546 [Punica granatum]